MTTKVISGVPPGHQPIAVVDEVQVAIRLDPYLSLKALAGYSGLSTRTLRDLLTDAYHPLPCYRVGGKILVRRSEFDRWVARFRQHGAPDLGAVAEAMLRELQNESNSESGGHARQLCVTTGRIGTKPMLGAGRVQNGGSKVALSETGMVSPLEANGPRRA